MNFADQHTNADAVPIAVAEEGSEQSVDHKNTKSARFKKLQKKLPKQVSHAIRNFNMIEDGDGLCVW